MGLTDLPDDLPIPEDDGRADHLLGMALPSVPLPSTSGGTVDLASAGGNGWLVVYVYPMTGRPDEALPDGWEAIPGARGCTPQSCAFRDHHDALRALDATVFGLSAQDTDYQRETADRLHLPYEVLSDTSGAFGRALDLPTMTVTMTDGTDARLYSRLTLIARSGVIEHTMYPVFPPDLNASHVEAWLTAQA